MRISLLIHPNQLWTNLQKLILGKNIRPSAPELAQMRQRIDALDQEIIHLLANRMEVAEQIGNYKKQKNLPPHQPNRWAEVRAKRLEIATNLGLSEEFTENLLELIHQESLQRQSNG